MIEFAMTFGLFLLALLGCMVAGFWSVEGIAATTATERAVRLAISAPSEASVDANKTSPNAAAVLVRDELRRQNTMLGTDIVANTSGTCRTWQQVNALYPKPTVEICITQNVTPPAAGPFTPTPAQIRRWLVTARITGCASIVVPSPLDAFGCRNGVAMSYVASVHPPVYQ